MADGVQTARWHAEKASRLAQGADELRLTIKRREGGEMLDDVTELYRVDEGRSLRGAEVHSLVALALAGTDVTTGKATVKRRLT